jgi:two-component system nitrogen regulation response regulator NtrX
MISYSFTERPAPIPMAAMESQSLLGSSAAMQEVIRLIERVGPTEASVLLTGESGSGKELAAQMIHERSARRGKPFIAINCGAIPAGLIEAELFGYEKGSFTGAVRAHAGVFERADGGTLLLDEVTEMPLDMQTRLLRVLESRKFYRVGASTEYTCDVRVIAATNRCPLTAAQAGQLREDLLYRLAVFPIDMPPLRSRGDDVELLANHFLEELNAQAETQKRLSAHARMTLRQHSWPGNVRELKNVVERMAILSGERVTIADLPEDPHESPFGEEDEASTGAPEAPSEDESHEASGGSSRAPGPPAGHLTLRGFREKSERQYIVDTLKMTGWNISRTAIVLGVERTNLHKKIRAYQIKRGEA